MAILTDKSNASLLKSIGTNLERIRVESQLQDADVVSRGGITRDTWHNLKSGRNVTLINLVRALRGLDRLDLLESLISAGEQIRPMDLVRDKNSELPRRVRRKTPKAGRDFVWGDGE